MNLSWFASILVHHPFIILSAVAVFSGTCILLPFTLKSMSFPNFQDPQMGFSTRGTTIANRLTAWTNLLKSTRPSGELTTNPKEFLENRNKNSFQPSRKPLTKQVQPKPFKKEPVYGSVYLKATNSTRTKTDAARWNAIKHLSPNRSFGRSADQMFCGNPDERYAHVVVTSKTDLFTLSNMLAMCRLEQRFMGIKYYEQLCIQNTKFKKCCKPWSIPNYLALLNNRPSCLAITEEDITATKKLLQKCSVFFHNMQLSPKCLRSPPYCDIPMECMRHGAVYNIFNFLGSTSFLPPNDTESTRLSEAMIFFPLACSTAILPYYHQIDKADLVLDDIKVVAIDFGIKSMLFDEYLKRDTWLMGSGALFVFLCMWFYTQSLFLTIMTISAIIFSLAISYFMYFLVFGIKFFPFMNLLATIVSIGIGADDAFIFCKIWQIQKQNPESSLHKIMTDTFQHAFVTMFVTALTTSVAFLGSYISAVTAISCFSIFAGTAVISNFVLMMTWFPASLVIYERSSFSNSAFLRTCFTACLQRWCCFNSHWNLSNTWFQCSALSNVWKAKEESLLYIIIKFKYVWCILLISLALLAAIIVFVDPKIQLPTTVEFQLFTDSHPFEQYDFHYKHLFWFNKLERVMMDGTNFKLPLRFVWGVLPIDNGDHFDPSDLGTMTMDPTFDMSNPESQEWLINFCQKVRQQPFYHSTTGPLLPNCFVETFMKSMKRKCYDAIEDKNQSPCCDISKFPFNRSIFDECIIEEMAEINETPSDFLSSRTAGPKFSKDQFPTIKAVIVEYDSTYSYSMSYGEMHEFYTNVEEWMKEELKSAPDTMKNGWFISDLEFYDLQRELRESTEIAILLSIILASIILFLSTLNILTSLYGIISVTGSILVTLAVLILLGWQLNVLESIAVSAVIGLTVDFCLHYSINYSLCPAVLAVDREATVRYALSYMVGPALMAAITTGAAGAFMIPSLILPYIQIGMFLVIVMGISWLYATFLLGSMLAIAGPDKNCGQFNYSKLPCFIKPQIVGERPQPPPCDSPEGNELEALAAPQRERRETEEAHSSQGNNIFSTQSPSENSAITIIMPDEN